MTKDHLSSVLRAIEDNAAEVVNVTIALSDGAVLTLADEGITFSGTWGVFKYDHAALAELLAELEKRG